MCSFHILPNDNGSSRGLNDPGHDSSDGDSDNLEDDLFPDLNNDDEKEENKQVFCDTLM